MGKPRTKFRERPKKLGAKKNQRVKCQKRRLVAAGMDETVVKKLTDKEARLSLKTVNRKKGPKTESK
jgi:hypothetical protein